MPHEERWPGIGIAIMFMFIGIAIFIGIIFSIANGSFGFGSFGSVWNLLWLFFVIWFISWIFFRPWRYGYMHRHGYRHWHQDEEDAIEILKRRYAKGEITEAQFRKMMAELRKHEHG